ncbi:MAG: PEGA domain-containing protein [Planctomycetota bacterium]
MARLLTIALLLLLPSCVWFDGDSRVFVSSDPQGARIWIDGEDSGHTTPAALQLGALNGSDHVIRVVKRGFDPEERLVSHYTTLDTTKLNEWVGAVPDIPFPTWATFGDLLFPFEVRWVYVPHNLHVKLFPEGTFPAGDRVPEAGTRE